MTIFEAIGWQVYRLTGTMGLDEKFLEYFGYWPARVLRWIIGAASFGAAVKLVAVVLKAVF